MDGRGVPLSLVVTGANRHDVSRLKAVLDAITAQFGEAGRYPFNAKVGDRRLVETIAALHKVKPENIVLGAGSQAGGH